MARRSSIIRVDIIGDASDLNRALGGAANDLQSFGQKTADIGGNLTRNVTVPLVALGGASVKAASDLGESINAVNVVFGEASQTVLEFGENAAEAVGLSQRAFNELATPLGALLQGVGFEAEAAAEQTLILTQRAADLASVFNTDVETAVTAIASALRGESEPIRQFGVTINEAAVAAKALELGLADTKAELTDNDKATARLKLIMEQTEAVAGDFANTSGELANQLRITKAETENVAASFGESLLPVTSIAVEQVGGVVDAFGRMPEAAQRTVTGFGLIVASAGPLLLILGKIAALLGTIGGGAAALTGIVAGAELYTQGERSGLDRINAPDYFGPFSGAAQIGGAIGDWVVDRINNDSSIEIDPRAVESSLDRRNRETVGTGGSYNQWTGTFN